MKPYLVIAALLLLSGCGAMSRGCAVTTGYDRVCVDGVSYLQFPSGVSVEYNADGTVRKCRP